MGQLTLIPTPLAGLTIVETSSHTDSRGRFVRIFCQDELAGFREGIHWKQANLSLTEGAGAIRGLHFQHPPAAELKLIRCISGAVFDVAVDLRHGSPTFLSWHGELLDDKNNRMMLIPEGFAHGFQVMSDKAELLYMHSESFSPAHDGRVRYDDPLVGITWPLPATLLSDRDLATQPLSSVFKGVRT